MFPPLFDMIDTTEYNTNEWEARQYREYREYREYRIVMIGTNDMADKLKSQRTKKNITCLPYPFVYILFSRFYLVAGMHDCPCHIA